jgi:energy-coupling factor transporter ATP-binding protein EcfA2
MGVLSRIVEWSKGLPDWQSDAVRRILVNNDLTDKDEKELLAMLKKTKGIEDPSNPAPSPTPLRASDVPSPSDSTSVVVLKSIQGVRNVNALAPDQTLEFAPNGVTVVYGGNASGKSGYSRILKRACRARGQAENILPNVYTTYDPGAVPEAVFNITVDGKASRLQWVDTKRSPDSLASIVVFDAETARFYVDENSEVVYIPYGLDVFNKLGDLCKSLKARLETELAPVEPLPKELRDLTSTTAAGRLIQGLTHETDLSEVEKLAKLTKAESERLEEFRKSITQLDANRPEIMAAQCRRFKSRIEKLKDAVVILDNGLSADRCSDLSALHTKARETARAAQFASQEAFKNQPLRGVGTEPWREMFEAARRYSELLAYPGYSFPCTATGSRCVLCQQPLEEEAKRRMQSFEDFIKQDTASQANTAATEFKRVWDDFCGLQLHRELIDPAVVEEIGEADPSCRELLVQYLKSVDTLAAKIRESCEKQEWSPMGTLADTPVPCLKALAEAMETSAKKWDATSQPAGERKMRDEFEELEARKVLSTCKSLVVDHLRKIVYRYRIQRCIGDTDTREISLRGRTLMNEAVTQVLKNNLESELRSLGADHLRLDLVPLVRAGTTFHYLRLNSTTYQNLSVSSVLSEGEQRAVAIASLLAEVRTASYPSGLIFDDPVSSLDHVWRHKVANRLVEEGRRRQIIIFTHDIVFLLAIEKECAQQTVPILCDTLRGSLAGTGVCSNDDVPWAAKQVGRRVDYLYARCSGAEKNIRTGRWMNTKRLHGTATTCSANAGRG